MLSHWQVIKKVSTRLATEMGKEYLDRLEIEIYEIEKQGANQYWVDAYEDRKHWDDNPVGLVLPFLLKMTSVDPIKGNIQHKWIQQTDLPDVDLDYTPCVRDKIKEHAISKYKYVCSVGSWVTFKPKSAIQSVARALGESVKEAMDLTTNLPDEFDEQILEGYVKDGKVVLGLLDYKKNLNDPDPEKRKDAEEEYHRYEPFYEFMDKHPKIVDAAFKLVGKINAQGTHAGGIIIADRPIEGIIPLSYAKIKDNKQESYISQWTEGRNTQLSKFGLVKFDILGLKTIMYIWQAGNLIEKNWGHVIDWDDMDPTTDPPRLGKVYYDANGTSNGEVILMNDPDALQVANDLHTDSIFQVETPIQRGIIKDGKVKTFWDLVAYNCLGRPGPINCCRKGALITTNSGYKKIEELDSSQDELTYFSDKVSKTQKFKVFYTGKRKFKKLTLSNGKVLFLTDNHVVFTGQGMKKVKDIKKGEILYAKSRDNQVS